MSVYSGRDIALFVVAFFFPPLAILVKRGCGIDFLINICLWALGAGKFSFCAKKTKVKVKTKRSKN